MFFQQRFQFAQQLWISAADALQFFGRRAVLRDQAAAGHRLVDFGQGESRFQFSVKPGHDIGWRAGEAFSLYLIGDSLGWRGAFDRALANSNEALVIAREMGHLQWECGALRSLGLMHLDLLSWTTAHAFLVRAQEVALKMGSPTWIRWAGAAAAMAQAGAGDTHGALRTIEAANFAAGKLAASAADDAGFGEPTLGERSVRVERPQEVDLLTRR